MLSVRNIVLAIRAIPVANWGLLDGSHKAVSHPRRLALFLSGAENQIVPANIEAWPSLSCTARCPLCPYIRNGARQLADRSTSQFFMNADLWSRLVRQFRAAGGLSVTFTGGGEPTLNPALPSFAAAAHAQGLSWGLYTNGFTLTPALIEALLAHDPEFIRVSVNSGDPRSHNAIYGLGEDAYWSVRDNIVELSDRAPDKVTIGLGYVTTPTAPLNFAGVGEFVEDVCGRASRTLDYIALRPAMLYYRDGRPVGVQPRASEFGAIPEQARSTLQRVCNDAGTSLQINDAGFAAIARRDHVWRCVATQWATSMTESGELYLLSEANGGTSPELRALSYGQVTPRMEFGTVWAGPTRRRLSDECATGQRPCPAWHKLSSLSAWLTAVRETVGVLDPATADAVASQLTPGTPPKHWMFV
jgi:hypothetical protein